MNTAFTPRFPGVRALLFDLDETLVVERDGVKRAIESAVRVPARSRQVESAVVADAVIQRASDLWGESPVANWSKHIGISSWEGLGASFSGDCRESAVLRAWLPTFRRQVWDEALAACGIPDPLIAKRLAVVYPKKHLAFRVPYPDVLPVLREIRPRFMLGVVTNGDSGLQRLKLRRSRLMRWFDTVVVAGDLGVGKPSPLVFAEALRSLAVSSSAAVMVGDSLRADIAGAHAAGIQAILMERSGRKRMTGIHPDARIESLAQLLSLI